MVSLPVSDLRRFDTHRLLPAKYSPNDDSVLTRLSGEDDEALQLIFELDNATNARIQAEEGLSPGVVANVRRSARYRLVWTPLRGRFVRSNSVA